MREPNDREILRALRRAEKGMSIDPREAECLLAARGENLERLVAVGGRVRDAGLVEAGIPGLITYSPKVFIPLTRLCRDRCHYCAFATDPASLRSAGQSPYLNMAEVVQTARSGAQAGCTEALFTLGDAPELRWPAAAEWLDSRGYEDTFAYLRAAAIAVLEETGLLPHLNPGVMSWQQIQRLRPVAPSMGLMLESSSRRLFTEAGGVHYGSPDKDPEVRLRSIADAGRQDVPFTTGVLVGIGESAGELIDSILAIRSLAREYGHIQEVIIQSFRAKPGTVAGSRPSMSTDAYVACVATARILLGPLMRVQVPPNLSEAQDLARLIAAGADDFGGVSPITPDHVNPERPWPGVEELRSLTVRAGFELVPRLAVHPRYVREIETWVDPRLHEHVLALANAEGLAQREAAPRGIPWQEPDLALSELALLRRAARSAANGGGVANFGSGSGLGIGDSVAAQMADRARRIRQPEFLPHDLRMAMNLAGRDPAALAAPRNRDLAVALMACDGPALETVCRMADDVRADAVGETITYVVNRNINFTNVCYSGCRFCAYAQREDDPDAFTMSLDEVGKRVVEAADCGASEICMQGGIHPRLPGSAYFDLAREVKRRGPELHLHAFSPMEVVNGAARSGLSVREWLLAAKEAGVDSIPGTAAEILDDDVRWILTKGKLPSRAWIDVISLAHEVGLPSSATMMYGHVDGPEQWVDHIVTIRRVQEATGGFTEFVPLPFVHQQAPIYLSGVARPGPTRRDNRAVHALARLMLFGAIDHVQASWVKLGEDGCAEVLNGGADDMGGTLMEESISRMAGSQHGTSRTPSQMAALATLAGRSCAPRTTVYGAAHGAVAAT
ncbi:MAG: bifunctional FO biosynthesis protein CofGH [Candidatus Nanopelagicales bacterium]|nr:bifunctional FO biosynthesis protein CofGH [Candidatus Nanopelagicales bacterium]MDZ4249909.1 bifunctional FO biosynthesis protein CofGH [Candidatus Nanopelagicales bacterium]